MDELTESHNRSRDIMVLLEKEASDIEAITQSVKNIAEETGLLALNASIEAARAGEEGAGFAVVAQQIRKLADESKQSVHRINELISRVQQRIKDTAQLIHEQHGLVVNESERTVSVDQTLQELTGTVEVFMKGAHEIGSKIGEQTSRVEQTHGIYLGEAHIIDPNTLEEMKMQSLDEIVKQHVNSKVSVTPGQVTINVTVDGVHAEPSLMEEDTSEGVYNEELKFGGVVYYSVENGKLVVSASGAYGMGLYDGDLNFTYEFKDGEWQAMDLEYSTEEYEEEYYESFD
ncbi:hypothetical protein G195_001859 [Phytophthora kernoviae 00238/432]|uniref:Methyl-accepting transducer domain-containing protein n=1 Tax=Phytophthora kernoviae 00238/432 TaxID=1284355 RepID=A0A8J4SQT1_9STRA|nr:hypothetical protein G195_001859 [Phytophthora kernoviae 00238/432]